MVILLQRLEFVPSHRVVLLRVVDVSDGNLLLEAEAAAALRIPEQEGTNTK